MLKEKDEWNFLKNKMYSHSLTSRYKCSSLTNPWVSVIVYKILCKCWPTKAGKNKESRKQQRVVSTYPPKTHKLIKKTHEIGKTYYKLHLLCGPTGTRTVCQGSPFRGWLAFPGGLESCMKGSIVARAKHLRGQSVPPEVSSEMSRGVPTGSQSTRSHGHVQGL